MRPLFRTCRSWTLIPPLVNQMETLPSIHHCIRDQLPIKGRKLSPVCHSHCQQITIGYLCGIQQTRSMNTLTIQQRDIPLPEFMPRMSEKLCQQLRHRRGRSRRTGIAGMAHNPQHSMFLSEDRLPRLSCPLSQTIHARHCGEHAPDQSTRSEHSHPEGTASTQLLEQLMDQLRCHPLGLWVHRQQGYAIPFLPARFFRPQSTSRECGNNLPDSFLLRRGQFFRGRKHIIIDRKCVVRISDTLSACRISHQTSYIKRDAIHREHTRMRNTLKELQKEGARLVGSNDA